MKIFARRCTNYLFGLLAPAGGGGRPQPPRRANVIEKELPRLEDHDLNFYRLRISAAYRLSERTFVFKIEGGARA